MSGDKQRKVMSSTKHMYIFNFENNKTVLNLICKKSTTVYSFALINVTNLPYLVNNLFAIFLL